MEITRTRLAASALLIIALTLTGCELFPRNTILDPRINNLEVAVTKQGIPPVVDVSFVIPSISNKRIRGVRAVFRSTLEPDRPFVAAEGFFDDLGNQQWQGTLPALNLGPYEVKIIATLRSGGAGRDGEIDPPIDSFLEGATTFNVIADNHECFNFKSESDGLQGWTNRGYRLVSDDQSDPPVEGCPDTLIWFNDALYHPQAPNCEPAEQFFVDLVSPPVVGRPGWAQSQGVATTVYWNIPGMTMQSIFYFTDVSIFAPIDEEGERIFHPQAGSAQSPVTYRGRHGKPQSEKNSDLGQLRLRFFGNPFTSAAEGLIKVKSVCPIPDRPG